MRRCHGKRWQTDRRWHRAPAMVLAGAAVAGASPLNSAELAALVAFAARAAVSSRSRRGRVPSNINAVIPALTWPDVMVRKSG